MGKALSRKSAPQRRLIYDRWKKSNWNIELKSTEVRSAIIEENDRLAFQLEMKTSKVEKLKEENNGIQKTLDEAKDENSSLHMELTCVKTQNEQLERKVGVETGIRTPLQPLNNTVVATRKRKSWDEYSDRHKKRKV